MSTKLVMIVDNSQFIRTVCEFICQREGFETVSFPDGILAMQWLANPSAPPPDLLFLDTQVPFVNGYKITSKIKARFRDLPIILLSWHDGKRDRLKARRAGAQEVIVKPFKSADIIQAIYPLQEQQVAPSGDEAPWLL